MKSRLLALLLAGIMLLSFAACGSAMPAAVSADTESEEESGGSVPQIVLDLSEEDDILLNGELKDGVYINRFFGIKFTSPDGVFTRFNDDATESTEIIPLKKAYESGYGGLMFATEFDNDLTALIRIFAAEDEQLGMTEEELMKDSVQQTADMVKAFGEERSTKLGKRTLLGEEHFCEYDDADPDGLGVYFQIMKDGFIYYIGLNAKDEAGMEYLLSLFEKI